MEWPVLLAGPLFPLGLAVTAGWLGRNMRPPVRPPQESSSSKPALPSLPPA